MHPKPLTRGISCLSLCFYGIRFSPCLEVSLVGELTSATSWPNKSEHSSRPMKVNQPVLERSGGGRKEDWLSLRAGQTRLRGVWACSSVDTEDQITGFERPNRGHLTNNQQENIFEINHFCDVIYFSVSCFNNSIVLCWPHNLRSS